MIIWLKLGIQVSKVTRNPIKKKKKCILIAIIYYYSLQTNQVSAIWNVGFLNIKNGISVNTSNKPFIDSIAIANKIVRLERFSNYKRLNRECLRWMSILLLYIGGSRTNKL